MELRYNPITFYRYRKVRGLSQRKLAKLAGVHWMTVHRVEQGQQPSNTTARKLAEALGFDLAEAVREEQPRSKESEGA